MASEKQKNKRKNKKTWNPQYSWNEGERVQRGRGRCRKASISRQCTKKKRYKDRTCAQHAVALIGKGTGKKGYERATQMRYYYCELCKGYHLTRADYGDFTITSNKERDL